MTSRLRLVCWVLVIAASAALLNTATAWAYPELQLAPLKYEAHLKLGEPQVGILDISNPTGSAVKVSLEVEAFRQSDNTGRLEYFPDERLEAAIVPAQREFTLGAREAVRTKFSIDPNRLGSGGAYGVIFVRTVPTGQTATATRVGTLLILDVAGAGTRRGQITSAGLTRAGGDATLRLSYVNTGSGAEALAFAPQLAVQVGRDRAQTLDGPFVFAGRERERSYSVAVGAHLGLTTVTVSDASGGSTPVTLKLWLVTGFWRWLAPLLVGLLLAAAAAWWFRRQLRRAASTLWHQVWPQTRPYHLLATRLLATFWRIASAAIRRPGALAKPSRRATQPAQPTVNKSRSKPVSKPSVKSKAGSDLKPKTRSKSKPAAPRAEAAPTETPASPMSPAITTDVTASQPPAPSVAAPASASLADAPKVTRAKSKPVTTSAETKPAKSTKKSPRKPTK